MHLKSKLNNHPKSKIYLLLIIILFFASSCRKDILTPNSNVLKYDVSMIEAKLYFEENLKDSKDNAELNPYLKTKIPDWKNAYYAVINGKTTIKVPVNFDHAFWEVAKKKHAKMPYERLNYLYFYKDTLNLMKTEWVSLFPDSAWAFGNRESYTGKIVIRDWNGNLIKGYQIKDGYTQLFTNQKSAPLNKLNLQTATFGNITSKERVQTADETPYVSCWSFPISQCNCAVVIETSPSRGNTCSGQTRTTCTVVGFDVMCFGGGGVGGGTSGTGGTGGNGNGNGGFPINAGNLGWGYNGDGTAINPYVPGTNCNPDPTYSMPNYPPPSGVWVMPCNGPWTIPNAFPEYGGEDIPIDEGLPYTPNPDALTETDLENATILDDGQVVIDNIDKYINCFQDGKTAAFYKLTLYVQQPIPGTNHQSNLIGVSVPPGNLVIVIAGKKFDVGHTFIGFQKVNTDGTQVQQFLGFYPKPTPGVPGIYYTGVIEDNSGHDYNISYSRIVNNIEFTSALAQVKGDFNGSKYNVFRYNCTDAALRWMNAADSLLPNVSRGMFRNSPGDFGEYLRQKSETNKVAGKAANGNGPCN